MPTRTRRLSPATRRRVAAGELPAPAQEARAFQQDGEGHRGEQEAGLPAPEEERRRGEARSAADHSCASPSATRSPPAR